MTEYPPYPAGRTGESAYYLMDGPASQRRMGLETLIQECEEHADGAPEGWDGSMCRDLRDEASAFLDELDGPNDDDVDE